MQLWRLFKYSHLVIYSFSIMFKYLHDNVTDTIFFITVDWVNLLY